MKINYKDIAFILFGIALLAAAILTPYAIKATQQAFTVVSTAPIAGCIANGHFPNANQCMIWQTPPAVTRAAILAAVVLIGAIFLTRLYAKRIEDCSRLHQFTAWNMIATCIAAGVILGIYFVMKAHSQSITIAANPQIGTKLWAPVHPQPFGPGLNPATIIILTLLYAGSTILKWFAVKIDPRRIAGLKKEKLFQ
jgi:hypothetical protein